jgi:ribosomal protein L11 methyltransferase
MAEENWLEVSMVVDGEYAEVVAEVLSRFAPHGVAIEATAIRQDPLGEGEPVGPLRVCAYLPVDEQLEETRRKLDEALWYLSRIRPDHPLPIAHYTFLQEVDWVAAWKQHYQPIPIGNRLMIVPAWMDVDTQGRLPIFMNPGMAFGTGTHPSTQLCLELIEDYPGQTVIDIGCGSGILSIAALKLGASFALGVDTDPEVIPIARENAEKNGVSQGLELQPGSVAEILKGTFSIRSASLVLANILAPVIEQLLEGGLPEVVDSSGYLILAGILTEQWEPGAGLREAVQASQLKVVETRTSGDWVAVCLQRI